jgi:hypothetical protein
VWRAIPYCEIHFVLKTLGLRNTHEKYCGGQYCGKVCEDVKRHRLLSDMFWWNTQSSLRQNKVLRCLSYGLPPKINSLYQGKVVLSYLCRYADLCPAHSCHCRHKCSCPLYWCSPCCTHHSACPCTHWCRHTWSGPCSWIMISLWYDFITEWAQYMMFVIRKFWLRYCNVLNLQIRSGTQLHTEFGG